tara:strand:- start:273 stop:653 length:381 start_codon:yes stop_codon:yes gene_type:complete
MPKGEMTLTEIRNLVRQHNKMSEIKVGMTRANLISAIQDHGYRVDHAQKKLVKTRVSPQVTALKGPKSSVSLSKTGDTKPQKRTKAKMMRAAGPAPVMTTKKPPTIPRNVKGKRVKPDRSMLIAGY